MDGSRKHVEVGQSKIGWSWWYKNPTDLLGSQKQMEVDQSEMGWS